MPLPLILLVIVIVGVFRFLSSRDRRSGRRSPRSVARRARHEPDSSPRQRRTWDAPEPTQRLTSWEEQQRRARGMSRATSAQPRPATKTSAGVQPIRPDSGDLQRRRSSLQEREPAPQPGPAPVTPAPTRTASRGGQATPPAQPVAGPPPSYPGDFEGPVPLDRIGGPGGSATGQVLIAWVPSREDLSRGDRRPVLVVGSEPGWLLAVEIITDVQPGAADRLDIGTGEWDGGEAQVLTDRIIRIHPGSAQETGSVVSRSRMLAVGRALRRR